MLNSARCSGWWAWEQASERRWLIYYPETCVYNVFWSQLPLLFLSHPAPISTNPFFFPGSSPTIFKCFFLSLFLLLVTYGVYLGLLAGARGITAGGDSWGQWPCQAQEKAFYSTPPHHPALPFFLPPLCRVSRSEEAIDVPFRADHSTVTYSHHFNSVRVSALSTANKSVFTQVREQY